MPMLPLICQVVGNIGRDTEDNILYSWNEYYSDNGNIYENQCYIEWETYIETVDGEEIEHIFFDASTSNSSGIANRLLWGLYQGQEIRTDTFIGAIFKTTYRLTTILGIPNSVTWIYAMFYIIYMIFIEIMMFIVDLVMLVPRKIKEWLN